MANELQLYSDQMAAAVEKAGRSTVSIDARNHVPGSGIVWSAAGEILTADHIVQRDENINVILPDGSSHSATIVGRDPGSDIELATLGIDSMAVINFCVALEETLKRDVEIEELIEHPSLNLLARHFAGHSQPLEQGV